MRKLVPVIALIFSSATAFAAPPQAARPIPSKKTSASINPPSMVSQNRFKKPEEVLAHYCERDAWGFIWSGWARDERQALSVWQSSPLPETVYLIRSFEVLPPQTQGNSARVEVIYNVIAATDGQGTLIEKGPKSKRVIYQLKKTGTAWKIESPSPLKHPAFVRPDRYPIRIPEGVSVP